MEIREEREREGGIKKEEYTYWGQIKRKENIFKGGNREGEEKR